MVTMDQNPDTPGEAADGPASGGATAYGALFSHVEDGQPAAPAKKSPARRTASSAATTGTSSRPARRTATRRSATSSTTADDGAPASDETATGEASGAEDTGAPTPPAGEERETQATAEEQDAQEQDTGATVTDEEDADESAVATSPSPFGMLFQAPDLSAVQARPARRRPAEAPDSDTEESDESSSTGGATRVQRGRRTGRGGTGQTGPESGGGDGGSQRARTTAADDQEQEAAGGPPEEQSDDGSDESDAQGRRRRRRGGKGRRGRGSSGEDQGDNDSDTGGGAETANESDSAEDADNGADTDSSTGTVRRRRRSNRRGEDGEARESRRAREEVTGVRGSTRLEAKRQRRREGREAGRRRTIITEAEFLARRESVERTMVVRGLEDRTQIGVLEDGVLVEHYVSRATQTTMVGNVYLGRVQNVLPSMEAAFVDIGKGRNAVLYAGEVNWDAAGLESNAPKRIENALKSGDSVLVQVTKDPIGHKGARLTSQVSLPGRYLVLVPGNSMTGISRKLPDTERARLKKILREVVPEGAGVIVRTAAEGASEAELRADVERLTGMWDRIQGKQKSASAPALLHGEPDMTVRVIRDVFNEDFAKVVVAGEQAWSEVSDYLNGVAPDLADRLEKWTGTTDVFTHYRVTEALAKAMDRKVWLPSGGSLVIDRTEAMTVVDVNTGKFVGSGGNLEETVTKNNIEAAEEIVRQLRLRDIGGIIVIDFIDMVLESNRDLVVRRLLECLGRDRTKHQVAEVTSLGLVQMTRKRVGAGLIEVFSEPCVHCNGRGIVVHSEPIDKPDGNGHNHGGSGGGGRRGRGRSGTGGDTAPARPTPAPGGPTPAQIAAAAHAAAIAGSGQAADEPAQSPTSPAEPVPAAETAPAEATAAGSREAEVATPGAATAAGTTPATVPAEGATAPSATGAARTSRGRSRGRATAAAAAPAEAPRPTQDTPETIPAAAAARDPETAPVSAPEPQSAPRPRRRRGRVVAPAGPPGGGEAEVTSATAEPATGDSQ